MRGGSHIIFLLFIHKNTVCVIGLDKEGRVSGKYFFFISP